jgi:hypothetical protein
MGLFDWLKRKDTADASITTFTVTTHGGSVDPQDPEQREALEQAERLIHEFLTGGAEQGGAGGAQPGGAGEESAGERDAGAFVFAAPAQVIVAGEAVSADDPRALEAMRTAAAKLREHGLDELAAELEARAGASVAADAPSAAGLAADAPAAAGPVGPSQALPSVAVPGPAQDAPADDLDAAPGAPADDLGDAPSAPAPPEPPAPPT